MLPAWEKSEKEIDLLKARYPELLLYSISSSFARVVIFMFLYIPRL